jgi:hypothetical protein
MLQLKINFLNKAKNFIASFSQKNNVLDGWKTLTLSVLVYIYLYYTYMAMVRLSLLYAETPRELRNFHIT